MRQCLRIIFILCPIVITIKFSSKTVSLLQSIMICLIKSLLQAYDLDSERAKFSVHSAYFFSKLKVSPVERLSWNGYTWTTMSSTFVAFRVRFHDKTRQPQRVTILTEKREKRLWELNLFSILKMIEFLSRHTDIRNWVKKTLTYIHPKELVPREGRMVLRPNLNRLNLTELGLKSLQSQRTCSTAHWVTSETLRVNRSLVRAWDIKCVSVYRKGCFLYGNDCVQLNTSYQLLVYPTPRTGILISTGTNL